MGGKRRWLIFVGKGMKAASNRQQAGKPRIERKGRKE
jgi:hypothetical protein